MVEYQEEEKQSCAEASTPDTALPGQAPNSINSMFDSHQELTPYPKYNSQKSNSLEDNSTITKVSSKKKNK